MEDWRGEIWERAELFAAENGRTLIGQLGYGYDGNVFATERQSAIKVLRFQRLYERERDVYLRLRSRSFVLDFAGAYLDRRPDYPNDVMEEWQADKLEQFGEERWETVQRIMAHFARIGIYLADVKRRTICEFPSTCNQIDGNPCTLVGQTRKCQNPVDSPYLAADISTSYLTQDEPSSQSDFATQVTPSSVDWCWEVAHRGLDHPAARHRAFVVISTGHLVDSSPEWDRWYRETAGVLCHVALEGDFSTAGH